MIAGLNPRQDKFVREYVKTGVGAVAARKAGYSPNGDRVTASQLLTNPIVSDAVKLLRLRLAEKLDISREKLINDVAHIAEQAQIEGEHTAAIAATTLILKAQGYLIERSMNVSVDVTQSHLDALQTYTDQRIDQALANHKADVREMVEAAVSAPVSNPTPVLPTDCNRVMDVMEHATHADSTDDATR